MNRGITAHMVVAQEDRFIWYAISSVLPYVSKLLIFDTGSEDKTVNVIKSFKSPKILFYEKGKVSKKGLTELRQEQIETTESDWIWIVDGDEVYPHKTARKIIDITQKEVNLVGIIVHRYDLLGDIYHYQDESIGSYNQFGKIGHYVLRLINKKNVSGLRVCGEYPDEYYADKNGNSIKNYGREKFAFIKERIFHAMYLQRSSGGENLTRILNRNKYKIELGNKVPSNEIPEVFLETHPEIVQDVSEHRSLAYTFLASIISPLKYIYRHTAA